jgi:hypothetical protein
MTVRYIILALFLAGCDGSNGVTSDAATDEEQDTMDPIHGCVTASDCAVGVDYSSAETCGDPFAYSTGHIDSTECVTALGEEPGASCIDCIEDTDAGRRGRLIPGSQWITDCVDFTCTATDAPCPVGDCPADTSCTSVLDCFLTYACHEGNCTSGCDTGMDCRPSQVCVREPPDSALGRCVNT